MWVVVFGQMLNAFLNTPKNRANIMPILTHFAHNFYPKDIFMINDTFFTKLTWLNTNRFALDGLSDQEFNHIYHTLLSHFAIKSTPNTWYLIGTDGCHLCHHALDVLHVAQTTQKFALHQLDLIDSTDDRLIDLLGDKIPILLTPKRLLCYPFGLLDVAFL